MLGGGPVHLLNRSLDVGHQVGLGRELEELLVAVPLCLDRLVRTEQLIALLVQLLFCQPECIHCGAQRLDRFFQRAFCAGGSSPARCRREAMRRSAPRMSRSNGLVIVTHP